MGIVPGQHYLDHLSSRDILLLIGIICFGLLLALLLDIEIAKIA